MKKARDPLFVFGYVVLLAVLTGFAALLFAGCDTPDSLYKKGVALIEEGKSAEAIPVFDKLIKKDPANKYAYFYRGAAYGYIGEHEKAIADFTVDINAENGNIASYVNRASNYAVTKNYQNAVADYSKYIEKWDGVIEAYVYYNLGYSYMMLNRPSNGFSYMAKAIEMEPDNILFLTTRGDMYRATGDYQKAIADYNRVLKIEPNNELASANKQLVQDEYEKQRSQDFWNYVSPFINNQMQNALDQQNRRLNSR
jgi:tetratricopeptide (TPR) repeat protein